MNKKKIIRMSLVALLVACFLFAYPPVAYAASTTGSEVSSGISAFFNGILECLRMICEGIIGICSALIGLIVDFVNWIIGLFI